MTNNWLDIPCVSQRDPGGPIDGCQSFPGSRASTHPPRWVSFLDTSAIHITSPPMTSPSYIAIIRIHHPCLQPPRLITRPTMPCSAMHQPPELTSRPGCCSNNKGLILHPPEVTAARSRPNILPPKTSDTVVSYTDRLTSLPICILIRARSSTTPDSRICYRRSGTLPTAQFRSV